LRGETREGERGRNSGTGIAERWNKVGNEREEGEQWTGGSREGE